MKLRTICVLKNLEKLCFCCIFADNHSKMICKPQKMRKTVLSFMLLLVHLCAVAEVRIVHQTVNAMTSPIGISHLNPRFGWAFEADYERGIMQEAYSISIYEANHLESPVFSTGMTEGDACVDVCIPDLQLAPCTSYCWKVTARLLWLSRLLPVSKLLSTRRR